MGALGGLAKLCPSLSLLPYPLSSKPLAPHTKYLQHQLEGGAQGQASLPCQLPQHHPCHNLCWGLGVWACCSRKALVSLPSPSLGASGLRPG